MIHANRFTRPSNFATKLATSLVDACKIGGINFSPNPVHTTTMNTGLNGFNRIDNKGEAGHARLKISSASRYNGKVMFTTYKF